MKSKKENFPEGYEDLFNEEGADPQEVKKQAKNHIFQLKDAKKHTKSLLKQQITYEREELDNLNQLIIELRKVVLEKNSKRLKQLLSEKIKEKKMVKNHLGIQKERIKVLDKTFTESASSHQQLLKALNTKDKNKADLGYIR